MGRAPCCSKEGLNRGAWTALEDKILSDYIKVHGEGKWRNIPKQAGEWYTYIYIYIYRERERERERERGREGERQ